MSKELFDTLATNARIAQDQATMNALWEATYGLEHWHFVGRGAAAAQ